MEGRGTSFTVLSTLDQTFGARDGERIVKIKLVRGCSTGAVGVSADSFVISWEIQVVTQVEEDMGQRIRERRAARIIFPRAKLEVRRSYLVRLSDQGGQSPNRQPKSI